MNRAGSKSELCYVYRMQDAVRSADEELQRLNEAAFDEAGVDLTQIDIMLALTPRERLRMLYESAASLARLMGDANTD